MLKWLLTIAVVVILLGLLSTALRIRVPTRRLPGDVAFRCRGRDYFFPFTSTILISLVFIAVSRLL